MTSKGMARGRSVCSISSSSGTTLSRSSIMGSTTLMRMGSRPVVTWPVTISSAGQCAGRAGPAPGQDLQELWHVHQLVDAGGDLPRRGDDPHRGQRLHSVLLAQPGEGLVVLLVGEVDLEESEVLEGRRHLGVGEDVHLQLLAGQAV